MTIFGPAQVIFFPCDAHVKTNPKISFTTIDYWQVQIPGNISKKSLAMTKQIWAYFIAVTESSAT